MWRCVFLHEFPDTNIRNFQALAGSPTPASLRLTPAPSPLLRTNAVGITPGEEFEYILAQTLDQVIGVSGRIRIRELNLATEEALLPIMRLGDRVEFRILQKPLKLHPGTGVLVPLARAFAGKWGGHSGPIDKSQRFVAKTGRYFRRLVANLSAFGA